jgi:hypothetical protein
MKLSFLVGAAVGYVLGARAGRERYETIVAWSRKVAGSQTFQSTAGVLRAQVDTAKSQALQTVAARLRGGASVSRAGSGRANGHHGR